MRPFLMKIILFDGDCAMCSVLIRFIARRDKKKIIFFANQYSAFAREQKELGNINHFDTIYFFNDRGDVFNKSRAVITIAYSLGGIWKLISLIAKVIPISWADKIYDLIARNRKRLMTKGTCVFDETSKQIQAHMLA
jgi:predicted DCC family thiol-disulfide oxidoreductase YuxK